MYNVKGILFKFETFNLTVGRQMSFFKTILLFEYDEFYLFTKYL